MIEGQKETSWILGMLKHLVAQEEGMTRARRKKMIASAMKCREGSRSTHFHDKNARSEKPLRFSPPGLMGFSGPGGYLRVESSAENLDSHFLPSLSFFGVVTMEVIFQPVARDTERELRGGTSGTSSGVGGSIGTRDGDGAVDGRLRIGRRNFGEVLAFSLSDGWLGALGLRGVNVSFPLIGVEGELRARPADRGRKGVISCGFPFSCIVDGRLLLDADPKFCRVSMWFVAVDGRRPGFRLLLLLCVAELVDVDSC